MDSQLSLGGGKFSFKQVNSDSVLDIFFDAFFPVVSSSLSKEKEKESILLFKEEKKKGHTH